MVNHRPGTRWSEYREVGRSGDAVYDLHRVQGDEEHGFLD
jgi:hypothetical protein